MSDLVPAGVAGVFDVVRLLLDPFEGQNGEGVTLPACLHIGQLRRIFDCDCQRTSALVTENYKLQILLFPFTPIPKGTN